MAALPRFNSAFKQLMSVHWWIAAGYILLFMGGYAIMCLLMRGKIEIQNYYSANQSNNTPTVI